MDDREVGAQVRQMALFIAREAEEKASEIRAAAQEEYAIQKQAAVEAEKAKIRREYERKRAQIDTRKAIERSTQLNAARLRVLQAQQDAVVASVEAARGALASVAASPAEYGTLLKALVTQAVNRFGAGDLVVRCVARDATLAREAAAAAAGQRRVTVQADLPPGSTAGGVVVSTADGSITCDNTLEARLALVQRQALPEIKAMLF